MPSDAKPKSGLLAFWKDYDRKQVLQAAQLADALGYDSFWIAEAWGYAAFPLLAEIAVKTKRIKIGTAIVNVFSRSEGLLAMNAATLDDISEGRFILGIGTSGARVVEGFHGREFKKPLTQVKEVVRVVRTLLSGKKLNEIESDLHHYRPFDLALTPHRRHIPIYIAALKEKAITGIGEYADGWIPTFWPYTELKQGRAWIEAGAKSVGRDPGDVITAPFTTVIPVAPELATRRAKERIALYVGGMGDYYKDLLSNFGYADECECIERLWKDKVTREQAIAAVTDGMMEALSIAGDPAYCRQELDRRRAFGIDLPIMTMPTKVDWSVLKALIETMAPR